MSYTLDEARAELTDSVLHVGGDTYDPSKLDRAIRAACTHFIRVTNCNKSDVAISLGMGVSTFNPITEVGDDWVEDQFIAAEISMEPVDKLPYREVRMEYEGGVTPTAGLPTKFGIRADAVALLDKPTDQAYTLTLTRRTPLLTFTLGLAEPTGVDLNIPAEWAHDIIWFGGLYYLLRLAPGHAPGLSGVVDQWFNVLRAAIFKFSPSDAALLDLQTVGGASNTSAGQRRASEGRTRQG